MIRFEKVGMRYDNDDEILSDIDFELEAGSFHFLTGPSGAGKSSLLKLLYLAHRPSHGKITFFEQDIQNASRSDLINLRRRIGIVFQDFRLLRHLSALENVALPLQMMGGKRKEIQNFAEEILEWVGLKGKTRALPPTLSGGEKQRVAIARAVVTKPHVLLADVPTGNVDPEMSDRFMKLFVELNKMGTTTVIATHNPALVAKFQAPTMTIREGNLAYDK